MNDLLRPGEDREPSPWPPRLLVITILILLTVAVVRHLPSRPVTRPARPAPALSAGPKQPGPIQLAGLGSGAAGLLDHADAVVRSTSPPRQQAFGCPARSRT